tara:strand:+ start:2806 stop:3216 length:411 start_codon:yes stop_codon:yes gene_type:complete
MTEAELLAEYALRIDRVWSMAQWWASVTFAVLLAAHLGVRTLNRPIVTIIIFLYTVFTAFVALTIYANSENILAIKSSLRVLEDLTLLGSRMAGEGGAGYLSLLWFLILSLTYLATVYYTLYCYFSRNKLEDTVHE